MKRYALIGYPVSHSRSPEFYNRGFEALGIDARYELYETKTLPEGDSLPEAYGGWNVTMPFKKEIMNRCASLSKDARLARSVNTIADRIGYTTDGAGMLAAVKRHGCGLVRPVIFGDGGAARSILAAAAQADSTEVVTVFSREQGEHYADLLFLLQNLDVSDRKKCRVFSYTEEELAEALCEADCLMQATSVGMYREDAGDTYRAGAGGEETTECLVPDEHYLHPGLVVAEAVYVPVETKLLSMARRAGCECVTGLEMLREQARINFRIFTGETYPFD